jgi:hypothetical protein
MSQQNIFFICVARLEYGRGVLLGSHSHNTDTDLNGVRKVLEQPDIDLQMGKHYSFVIGEVAWHLIQGITLL